MISKSERLFYQYALLIAGIAALVIAAQSPNGWAIVYFVLGAGAVLASAYLVNKF